MPYFNLQSSYSVSRASVAYAAQAQPQQQPPVAAAGDATSTVVRVDTATLSPEARAAAAPGSTQNSFGGANTIDPSARGGQRPAPQAADSASTQDTGADTSAPPDAALQSAEDAAGSDHALSAAIQASAPGPEAAGQDAGSYGRTAGTST